MPLQYPLVMYGPYIDEPLTLDRDLNGNGSATDPGERLFYHANTLHSLFALGDSNRTQPERDLYDAYGRVILWLTGADAIFGTADDTFYLNAMSTVDNVHLFTGRDRDLETHSYHYRRRFLLPRLGRFLSRDPNLTETVHHSYFYVDNQPTLAPDPYGLMPDRPGRQICCTCLMNDGRVFTRNKTCSVSSGSSSFESCCKGYFWQSWGWCDHVDWEYGCCPGTTGEQVTDSCFAKCGAEFAKRLKKLGGKPAPAALAKLLVGFHACQICCGANLEAPTGVSDEDCLKQFDSPVDETTKSASS